MTPPPAAPTRQTSARRWRARATLCALALLATAGIAHAAPAPINPYEATVEGDPSGNVKSATIAEALRQVAVRATGRRAAAGDPALAALYGNARQYVQTLTPAGAGQVTVGFDAAAIEPALARAGQPLWNGERPVTLVLLIAAAGGQLADPALSAPARRALDHVAQLRGVALVYPTRAPAEQLGARLDDVRRGDLSTVAELAQRYGAEEVLVGILSAGEAHYSATGRVAAASLAGGAEEALNALVDRYAADQALAPGTTLTTLTVELHGVKDARTYATLRRALEALGPVRAVSFSEAERDVVRVSVTVRGGAEALRRAVAQAPHLALDSAAGAEPLRLKVAP